MIDRFIEIYKNFWRHFFDIKHPTSRKDFLAALWWNLIIYLLIIGYMFIYYHKEGAIFGIFVFVIYTVAVIIPLITLLFRRYQDVGISGWWQLLTGLLPILMLIARSTWLSKLPILTVISVILLLINVILLLLPHHAARF